MPTEQHEVFISYSAMDKPAASAICEALERQGIGCWIAPRDVRPGQDWSEGIIDAISECRLFLLVLSSNSNVSEQVKREVQNAVSETKILLPLRVEDVALSKHMRYFIGTPHWLDALPPPIETHLDLIVGAIAALLSESDEAAAEDVRTIGAGGSGAQLVYGGVSRPARAKPPIVTPEQAARVEALLGPRLGVVSSRVVKKSLGEASGYDDLCRRVAEHIPGQAERDAFLAQCGPAAGTQAQAPAGIGAASASALAAPAALAPEQVKAAESALARHIGPMASVLARRAARQASSLADFHARLAAELPTEAEKRQFLASVKAR